MVIQCYWCNQGVLHAKIKMRRFEIPRNLDEFQEKFKERTSDPDNFLTIFEIEEMWSDLINKTNVLYSDYLNKMGLISAKKSW